MPLDVDERIKRGKGSYSKGSEPSLGDLSEDDVARGLADAERYANSGDGSGKQPVDAADINNQENTPQGGWSVNRSEGPSVAGPSKMSLKGSLKKKSALGALISLVFGAGLGFSALFSPGMLIVHMKEIMVERFDTSSISMNARSGKLLQAKVDGATSGRCGSVISVGCRFSSLSEKNVRNLRAAGIDVEPSNPNALGGKRYKPTAYKFTDSAGTPHTLKASEFAAFSKTNPEFRAALKKAYNPRFSAFSGKAWKRVASHFGINKQANKPLTGTPEENAKALNEAAKNPAEETRAPRTADDFIDEENGCNRQCAEGRLADYNSAVDEIGDNAGGAGKAAREALESVGSEGAGATLGKLTSVVKITGVVDNACMAYGTVRAVGIAAKTVRAIQLARYAMIFLKAADEIKAGTADAETIAYLGGVLTNVAYDITSTNQRIRRYGSATDSFGYKFAAFGDSSASKNSMSIASQYLAGGGFVGELSVFTDRILSVIPGGRAGAQATCGKLANPAVQVGSFIAGIALAIIPGGQGVTGSKLVSQGVLAAAIQVGLALLPTIMADIVAGTITDDIDGEHSGDAYTSGADNFLAAINRENANPPLDRDQAIEYQGVRRQAMVMQAEEDRATLSPFDINSRYTFLGTIVHSLTPFVASSASVPSKIFSTLSLSLSSLFGKASAVSDAEFEQSLGVCTDIDYIDMGLATDPFCNVIYAMPQKYLNRDTMSVLDSLAGQYNDETGEPLEGTPLSAYISTCVQRTEPLGYTGADNGSTDGAECKVNDENANYYLYWMDILADEGMSGEQG